MLMRVTAAAKGDCAVILKRSSHAASCYGVFLHDGDATFKSSLTCYANPILETIWKAVYTQISLDRNGTCLCYAQT